MFQGSGSRLDPKGQLEIPPNWNVGEGKTRSKQRKGQTDADPARAAAIGLLHGRGHGHAIGAPRVGARSVPD